MNLLDAFERCNTKTIVHDGGDDGDIDTNLDLKRRVMENAGIIAMLRKRNRVLNSELTKQMSIANGVCTDANTDDDREDQIIKRRA